MTTTPVPTLSKMSSSLGFTLLPENAVVGHGVHPQSNLRHQLAGFGIVHQRRAEENALH